MGVLQERLKSAVLLLRLSCDIYLFSESQFSALYSVACYCRHIFFVSCMIIPWLVIVVYGSFLSCDAFAANLFWSREKENE